MTVSSPAHAMERFAALCQAVGGRPPRTLTRERPVWIFGAGNFGRDLCKVLQGLGYEVGGFIETKPKSSSVLDRPVLSWSDLHPKHQDVQLALGIFNRGMAFDQLLEVAAVAGYPDVLMPWDLYRQFGTELGWRFWLSGPDPILKNADRIANVHARLADEESRKTLLRICSFRLGQDIAYASFKHEQDQYFNELTLPAVSGRPMVYVDCGAYNGDTYLDLISKPDVACKTAYLFEPDPENYKAMVQAVQRRGGGAVCLPMAVAQEYSMLTFNAGNGEGGAIAAGGNVHIAAAALDQMLPDAHVDFIKLDIEGAEALALEGAAQLIRRTRPVLALSLYHQPEDVWALPELLFELCPDYEFFVRQHYYNTFDSVLYARPRR